MKALSLLLSKCTPVTTSVAGVLLNPDFNHNENTLNEDEMKTSDAMLNIPCHVEGCFVRNV